MAAPRGWQPVTCTLAAPGSLGAVVDLVVHTAACLGQDKDMAEAVNVEGTRLAEAVIDAGAGRFVHISTMSVHADLQPDGLEDDSPLAAGAAHPYVATKAAEEAALGAVRSPGLPTVILRPGAICGLVHSQRGDERVARLRQSGWPGAYHPDDRTVLRYRPRRTFEETVAGLAGLARLAARPGLAMTAVASAGPGHRAPGVSGCVRCLAQAAIWGRVWRWPRC